MTTDLFMADASSRHLELVERSLHFGRDDVIVFGMTWENSCDDVEELFDLINIIKINRW